MNEIVPDGSERQVSRSGRFERMQIDVSGLSCAGDAVRLERQLGRLVGMMQVTVNPVTEIAYVEFDPAHLTLSSLTSAIAQAGFRARIS